MKIRESRKKLMISGRDKPELTKNAKFSVVTQSAEIFVFTGPDLAKMTKNTNFWEVSENR